MEKDIRNNRLAKDLISIIIPFHNRANLLIETLRSIKNQNYEHFEVLIIDDHSERVEVESLMRYLKELKDQRFQYLVKSHSYIKGANGSRYMGLQICNGEYIKWFDSDDIMEEDFLKEQISLCKHHSLDGVLTNCEVRDANLLNVIKDRWRPLIYSETPILDYCKTSLAWQTGAGLWKTEKMLLLNAFKESLDNAQEWVFHFKILTSFLKVGVESKARFIVRSHSDSISQKTKEQNYILNKFKSRIIALARLISSGNHGVLTILKSLMNIFVKVKPSNYHQLIKIIFKNFRISYSPAKASLNKLG